MLGDPRFVTAGGGTVRLADLPFTVAGYGRTRNTIELNGLQAGTDLRVSLREHRNGALVREETTA